MNHRTQILLELYKRNDFSELGLFDKQLQALSYLRDDLINEVLFGGGSRGGKSWLGSKWQLFNRLTMPESNGIVAREELTKLKDTTLLTFIKVAKYYGLDDNDFVLSGQSPTAEFKNGSRIFFREIKYIPSDPEFDRLGSYDLTDAFLDEAQQIHSKARSVLRGRFSILEGEGWKTIPKSFYSCNPRRNWIYNDFVKPQAEGEIDSDKVFIKSLPADNPHNDQSYIDNLLKSDDVTVQRLVYGNFEYDDDPAVLVDNDAVSDLFTNDHVKGGSKHLSADLAMQGRDKFIVAYMNGGIIRILSDIGKTTGKQIENTLKDHMINYNVGRSNCIADSDGMGAYLESYINGIKEFHGGGRPVDRTFNNIKSECAFKLAEKINKRELKIEATDRQREEIQKQLLSCLKRDKIDVDDGKKKLISKDRMKESLGSSPDYFDALLMLMYFNLKKSYF